MKKVTINMNGHNVAMFTIRASKKVAAIQAEFKMKDIANRFKVDISVLTYSIR